MFVPLLRPKFLLSICTLLTVYFSSIDGFSSHSSSPRTLFSYSRKDPSSTIVKSFRTNKKSRQDESISTIDNESTKRRMLNSNTTLPIASRDIDTPALIKVDENNSVTYEPFKIQKMSNEEYYNNRLNNNDSTISGLLKIFYCASLITSNTAGASILVLPDAVAASGIAVPAVMFVGKLSILIIFDFCHDEFH